MAYQARDEYKFGMDALFPFTIDSTTLPHPTTKLRCYYNRSPFEHIISCPSTWDHYVIYCLYDAYLSQ